MPTFPTFHSDAVACHNEDKVGINTTICFQYIRMDSKLRKKIPCHNIGNEGRASAFQGLIWVAPDLYTLARGDK